MRPRKIQDDVLLQLLREGKSRKEAAAHFSCSIVAIHKKLKKILPKPQTLERLTDKERKFVEGVAQGKSRTQAAYDAYEIVDRNSAKSLQSQLMQKDDVRVAIAELMDIYGLTRGYRINKLKTHVDAPDPNISLKAIEQTWKVQGLYLERHVNMNVNLDYPTMTRKLAELKQQHAEAVKRRDALVLKMEANARGSGQQQEALEAETEATGQDENAD